MSKASILAGFKTDFQAGISTIKNTTIDDTGFLALPQGTTAQRVGIATTQGMIRYNTTTNKVEGYYEPGSNWKPIGGGAAGGGSDEVFVENTMTVSTDYELTAGKSASSVGPITINSGITVTIPSGQNWIVLQRITNGSNRKWRWNTYWDQFLNYSTD